MYVGKHPHGNEPAIDVTVYNYADIYRKRTHITPEVT
jgi:hypothetical protein